MRGAIMPTLTIREAAAALGVSTDTIRRGLKAGRWSGTQVSTGARGGRGGFMWYVDLPDDPDPDTAPTVTADDDVPGMALVVQVVTAERDTLRGQVDDLRAERDRLLAIIDMLASRVPAPAGAAYAAPDPASPTQDTPEPAPTPEPVPEPPAPAVTGKVAQPGGRRARVSRAWDALRGR